MGHGEILLVTHFIPTGSSPN